MRTLSQWLADYAASHQHSLNQRIHHVCVPAIVFSIIGITHSISPYLTGVLVLLAILFYLRLSWRYTLAAAIMFVSMWALATQIPHLLWVCVAVFLVAWVGQFYGHHVEGKKPSFFKDVQFLLIGPLWVFQDLGLKTES